MPPIVQEKYISRINNVGLHPRVDIFYIITGTTDDLIARTALYNFGPGSYLGLGRQEVEVRQLSDSLWEGVAHYTYEGQDGDLLYQFETTGGTQHITQALEHIDTIPATGITDAQDFGGVINARMVNGQIVADGCDIVAPVYQWSESHYFVAATVTPAFRGNLYLATGTVNQAPFGDGQAGEVLFLGANGTRRAGPNGPDFIITYRFAAQPNCTVQNARLQPSGFSAPITKNGWDYIWFSYRPGIVANATGTVVEAAHVERVYVYSDFNLLGIPTDAYQP